MIFINMFRRSYSYFPSVISALRCNTSFQSLNSGTRRLTVNPSGPPSQKRNVAKPGTKSLPSRLRGRKEERTMKKRCAGSAALLLALGLLAGCAAGEGGGSPGPAPSGTPHPLSRNEAPAVLTLTIVEGAEDGNLLLAGEGAGEVYRLSLGEIPVTVDGAPAAGSGLRDGMTVEVAFDGTVEESFPARLGTVYSLETESGSTDDRCGLYLQVLEDLWAVDAGLNSGVTQVGVDLSGLAGLTEGEKSAVAWAFGESQGLEVVAGTLEELWQEGYFTPMTEPAEGYPDSLALYQWEEGVHFTLATDTQAAWNLPDVEEGEEVPVLTAFDAQKWRSGLGAYLFSGCVAQRGGDGTWTYTVDSEAIA